MRARIVLLSVVIAAAAAGWFVERTSASRLQTQLDSLRDQHHEFLALRSERARLRGLLPDAIHLTSLNSAMAERDRLRRAIDAAEATLTPAPFSLGEWTPCVLWSNHGQATPRAAVETALWAAAGGDVTAMQSLLELDAAARNKAEKLLEQLPPGARNSYATPEALIASVTMKNIPLTEAQIAWFHESDHDHAAIGVLLGNSDRLPEAAIAIPAGKLDNSPPALSDNRNTRMALLALHRSGSGWRLVVPASAVDRIARELGAPGN
jgi:hypothetical protein